MEKMTIQGKRNLICAEADAAKREIIPKVSQLEENLEYINRLLFEMKRTRKAICSLIYLKLNWINDAHTEAQLKLAEKRLKDYSHLHNIAVLERKLLKNRFKQAQREYSKKLKRIKSFDKKHFSNEE